MLAVVKTARGVGNVEIRDVPEPWPSESQVKLEIEACARGLRAVRAQGSGESAAAAAKLATAKLTPLCGFLPSV
jgi:hypothetical protein